MKKVLLIGILGTLLSGCSIMIDFRQNSNQNSTPIITSKDVIVEKPGSIEQKGLKGTEYLDYYGDIYQCEFFPSVGTPKMLVVPVLFSDTNINSLMYNSSKIFSDLDKTFNGNNEDTGWESVSSYYKKSSYNNLEMSADVIDSWITLDKTLQEIMNLDVKTYKDPTWYIVDYVVEELKSQGMDMNEYDSNNDGFIDGIWLVYGERNYSHWSNQNDDIANFLWAYTFWENNNSPVIGNPKANAYCWGSYDFMYEGVNDKTTLKVDAHTFIHETGHMLGLDDYYDYDENSKLNPAGCLDMMDYNIGDHNAYSKFLLGWVEPQVFNYEGGTYTLNPFESSGDCLIITSSPNTSISPLEEYLIIEFYTPTGLNELDSTYSYASKYPLMFTQKGVKIYHIDARLGAFTRSPAGYWKYENYIRNYSYNDLIENTDLKNTYFDIFASNTSSRSYNENYKLLNLLSEGNSETKYYYNRTYAKNRDLFIRGSSLSGFKFNDGNVLDLEIVINSLDESAKIFIG